MLLLIGVLLFAVVSTSDYVFRANDLLELSAFYLIPISFFTWFLGKRAGITLVLISLAMDFSVRVRFLPRAIGYWDELVWCALYISSNVIITQLRRLYERERRLSRIDPLTLVENRRAFFESAEKAKNSSDRDQAPLSVAYLDLDNFKQLNDHMGHTAGDKLLAVVADEIRKALRPTDTVARIGGDEFAILLPRTDKDTAARILDRVRSELNHAMKERYWRMTFSIGLVSFSPPLDSVMEMLGAADEAMYSAKNLGKNRLKQRDIAM